MPPTVRPTDSNDFDPVAEDFFQTLNTMAPCLGDNMYEPSGGLLILGRLLLDQGYHVTYLDLNAIYEKNKYSYSLQLTNSKNVSVIAPLVLDSDIVLISSTTPSFDAATQLAKLCRTINGNTKIIMGGMYISLNPFIAAQQCMDADLFVIGPAEDRIVEILNCFRENRSLDKIAGVIYNEKDKLRDTLHLPINYEKCIDNPSPAWELLANHPNQPVYRVFSSYGCDYKCTFCAPAIARKNTIYYRKIQNVIADIELLVDKYDVKEILLGDLTFFNDFEHSYELCSHIIKRNLQVDFWCQTRFDKADKKTLSILTESGCVQLALGLETFNDMILKGSHKDQTEEQILSSLLTAKEFPINIQVYVIIGLPGDDYESISNTIYFIERCINDNLIDTVNLAQYVPFPGTGFDADINLLDNDLSAYSMATYSRMTPMPVFETSTLSRFQLKALYNYAMASFSQALIKRNETPDIRNLP